MVRREQGARHGSTESSGADTVKDGVGGNGYNGDPFVNPMRDRLVLPSLPRLLCTTWSISMHSDLHLRIGLCTEHGKSPSLTFGIGRSKSPSISALVNHLQLRPV